MGQTSSRTRAQLPTAALWLIVLWAALLRLFRLGHQSLWADEGNSASLAGRSLQEIAQAAAADIHPPLYYWLLHFWTQLFGNSEISLRSLSVVFGVGLVWLAYLLGRRLYDRRTGLVAAFFAAVNPFLIYYSQEARMYALLAFLAALLFYGLIRFILHESVVLPADGSGRGITFSTPATALIVLSAIAGLYTHYSFPVVLGSVTVLYLLWVYDSRRRGFVKVRLLHWVLLLIVVAFFYSPWLSTAYRQLTTWPRATGKVDINSAIAEMMRLLALGPVTHVNLASAWMTVFLVLFVLGLWPWTRSDRRRAHWLSWGLPLLWLAAPVAMMLVGGVYRPAYLKFLLVSVVPFCLLMARGATAFAEALERLKWRPERPSRAAASAEFTHKRRSGRRASSESPAKHTSARQADGRSTVGPWLAKAFLSAALLLVFVPSVLTLGRYYFDPAAARDDYREMAAYIQAVEQAGDAIILNAPGQRDVFGYYYRGQLPVYGLPEQRPPDPQATLARLQQIAGRHRRLYGLFWATDESDPQHIVEGWLDTHAYKAMDTWHGNVRFVIYATQEPAENWPVRASGALLGDQIELVSYALSSLMVTSGDILQLRLIWRARYRPAADYTVFVQLLDERDQVIAQRDAPPVSGGRPTSGWQAGEQVVDNHGVLILPGTAPGDYRLIVGMYDSQSGQRLPVGNSDYIELGTVRVNRPAKPPPLAALNMQHREAFSFEEITLLGHDRYKRGFRHAPDTPLHPNDLLHLTFYWRADVKPTAAWRFTARLVQGSDKEVASVSGPLVSELYPTLNWEAGEIVRGEHDLLLPSYLQPGRYQLQLFLHTGNPQAVVDRVNLGTVVISK